MDWMFYCLGQGRKTRKTHEDIAHVETSLELELNSSRLNRQHPWQNLIIKTVSPFTINKIPVLVSFNRIIRCLSGWHGQSCFSISCNLQWHVSMCVLTPFYSMAKGCYESFLVWTRTVKTEGDGSRKCDVVYFIFMECIWSAEHHSKPLYSYLDIMQDSTYDSWKQDNLCAGMAKQTH